MKSRIDVCKGRLLLSSTLLLGVLLIGSVRAAEPPNFVLVMSDDQGWGDMGYYGRPRLQTPNFDALAREGLRFDGFHSAAPVCSPTRGSVLTGRTPNRYGCFQWGYPIRPQELTIAEALKQAGYRTGHFGKWHLGSVQAASPVSPGASGFDVWASSPNYFDLDPILSEGGKAVPHQGDSSDVTVDVALKFIRASVAEKQRFLAVVWFGSPHDPHEPLEADRLPYAGMPKAQQNYLGELTAMDRAFGRLRNEIRELGIRDNTVLLFSSDNGALPAVGSSGGRRGAKGKVYEGGLLVPALLEWPERVKAPRTVKTPCVTSDIFPTVLELAGVKVDPTRPLDGVSLVPLIEGRTETRPKPIGFWDYPTAGLLVPAKKWMEELYASQSAGKEPDDPERLHADAAEIHKPFPLDRFPGHSAWLDGSWKFHRIENPKDGKLTYELYNLDADPREANDLLAKEPERSAAMQAALEEWLRSVARSQNGEDYRG
ncbi:sulfatase family protein [Paludisphaera rhizosphaerae]|uniref:sulfatase family protein n=1 Tax=Paludisphaera rhizosphaerae TaxID=2711216 RepID=UPI0013ECECDD|nr:sulfatase-like hydrolase/transferase [Paludisphaera rhizosphaerae]